MPQQESNLRRSILWSSHCGISTAQMETPWSPWAGRMMIAPRPQPRHATAPRPALLTCLLGPWPGPDLPLPPSHPPMGHAEVSTKFHSNFNNIQNKWFSLFESAYLLCDI